MKLGVFDSGIGGMTVLAEIRRRFPEVDIVYLGDTANVPYGTKSAAQVRTLASEAVRSLASRGVDAIVVACNTASAVAMEEIRKAAGTVPVIGVVEAGVEATARAVASRVVAPGAAEVADPSGALLVLATRATVNSHIYARLLNERLPLAQVIEQACPLLVPMIEEGWRNHAALKLTIEEYVRSHRESEPPGTVLLACTHYPWIENEISAALPRWRVVNSASCVADFLAERFQNWLSGTGTIEWIFTDSQAIPEFARQEILRLNSAPVRAKDDACPPVDVSIV